MPERETGTERVIHAVMACLFSAGILLPVLGILKLTSSALPALLLTVGLTSVLEAGRLRRTAGIAVAAAAVCGTAFWLLALGGWTTLTDVLRAMTLHVNGITWALPLIGPETAMILTVLCGLCGFLLTLRSAGTLPCLLLGIATVVMIWLSDRADLFPLFLPALTAIVALMMLNRHADASPVRVLPLAAVLAVLAWLISPQQGVIIPEFKEKADDLRRQIMDTLFYTEPRDVFSLSSEGYYPQGLGQMGGPAAPTDHTVMQVSTPKTVWLRGAVMNEYNGRVWKNTTGGRRYLWNGLHWRTDRERLFNMELPTESLRNSTFAGYTVSTRMLSDSASTLFVPQRISEIRTGGDLILYFNNSSELFATRNLSAGDTWSVQAALITAGDAGLGTLISASAAITDPDYTAIRETYLQIPAHIEQPVYELAAAAAGTGTDYEKALSLCAWLSRTCRYTPDVEPQPENVDFVTHFLINTREGYCVHFASAMTLLCRMIGLPARYVEGYLAVPDENGHAVVTGLDAHAWTEVYFPSFGWLTFDATPRRNDGPETGKQKKPDTSPEPDQTPEPKESPEPQQTPEATETPGPDETPASEETPEPESENTPSSQDTAAPDAETEDTPRGSSLLFLWLLIPVLAILLAWRIRITSPQYLEKKAGDENSRFEIWTKDVYALLRADGLSPQGGESPLAFMRRIDRKHCYATELNRLGESICLTVYGNITAEETDTAMAREIAGQLKGGLSLRHRFLYLLHRIR